MTKKSQTLFLLLAFSLFFIPGLSKDDKTIPNTEKHSQADNTTYTPKETGKLFLWKVTSEKTTLHLLGSIHLAKKELYPLDKAIEDAYSDSDNIVVELDATDPKVAAQSQMLVMQKGLDMSGSVANLLEPKEITKLKELLPPEIPFATAEKLKPWLLAMSVEVELVKKAGYKKQYGIDKYFIDKAKIDKKTLLALEQPADQINAISGGSSDEQKQHLKNTVNDSDKVSEGMKTMFELWNKGDASGLYQISVTDSIKKNPYMKDYLKRLSFDRNLKMLEKIEGYLKTGKKYFVIVGSLHTVGKEGLAQLLKDKGYTVTQAEKTKK